MRILHTVEFYYPHIGGAEEVVRQISERLTKRGHVVTVATSHDGHRDSAELNGVSIREFKIGGNAVKGFRGDTHSFVKYLLENDFDLIMNYAAQSWPTDLTYSVLDRLHCAKVLAPCGYSGLAGLRRFFYRAYFFRLPRILQQYDTIIYHSANYRDKWFGDRHGLQNYVIIPNGVNSAEFTRDLPSFREAYAVDSRYLLLSVSNHYRLKGHNRLIETLRLLGRDDVTLVIIGRDPESLLNSCWKSCRRVAARDRRLLLVDDAPRSLVVSAFKEADLFLLGSHLETFPLVLLEAMASATPFISFDVGNVRELSGGYIVSNVEEMAGRVKELLTDHRLRQSLGQSGRGAQLAKYEWDWIVDAYEELYERLVRD